ncbi:hypothetical protein [Treponema sp. R6D11]
MAYYNAKLDKKAINVFNYNMQKSKQIVCVFVCLAGVVLNTVLSRFLHNFLGIPLYLDTAFTMTVTFFCGLFWGVLTGAITNLLHHSIYFFGLPPYLYTLCNIAVALVTAQFIRWFPRELDIGAREKPTAQKINIQILIETVILLVMLSFALCVVISVLGGFFATLIDILQPAAPATTSSEMDFKSALIRKGLPLIVVEIGSRIPVNLLDRLVSSFLGYGTALLLAKVRQIASLKTES